MKKHTLLYLLLLSLVGLMSATAQTNTPPAAPGNGIPTDLIGYWDLAIAAISPILVWVVSLIVPRIPKVLLPSMTPLVGIAVGLALNKLAGANLSWFEMGKAGALAVFVREVINQAITKRLATEPPGNDTP